LGGVYAYEDLLGQLLGLRRVSDVATGVSHHRAPILLEDRVEHAPVAGPNELRHELGVLVRTVASHEQPTLLWNPRCARHPEGRPNEPMEGENSCAPVTAPTRTPPTANLAPPPTRPR